MSSVWLRVVSCVLVLLLPATMIANDAVGMMSASGQVTIDGRRAAANAAVFQGEKIATSQGSHALVIGRGAMVSLSSNTTLSFGPKAMDLTSGLVVVSSDRGTATNVENVLLSTVPGARSKFLAKRVGDEVQLVALAGQVVVSDGAQEQSVPANTGVKIKLPKSSGSAAKMSALGSEDMGLLIAIGAAVAAGVSLGIVNALNSTPASPSVP